MRVHRTRCVIQPPQNRLEKKSVWLPEAGLNEQVLDVGVAVRRVGALQDLPILASISASVAPFMRQRSRQAARNSGRLA